MPCVLRVIVVIGFLLALPAHAEILLCAPVAVAETIGTSGPLTISAADKELGNPVLFWIDTRTGELQEHAEGGDRFTLQRLLREIEAGQLQLKNAARNIR